jgi:hypothetical protein
MVCSSRSGGTVGQSLGATGPLLSLLVLLQLLYCFFFFFFAVWPTLAGAADSNKTVGDGELFLQLLSKFLSF